MEFHKILEFQELPKKLRLFVVGDAATKTLNRGISEFVVLAADAGNPILSTAAYTSCYSTLVILCRPMRSLRMVFSMVYSLTYLNLCRATGNPAASPAAC